MKEKWKLFTGAFIFILVITFFVLDHRYPFVTEKVGKWSVGYNFLKNPIEGIVVNPNQIISHKNVDALLDQKGHYIADPFFVKDKGCYFIFTELKGQKDADIALFTSEDGKEYHFEGTVLDEEFHLSYPQVFKFNNDFYMLPEAQQSGQVLLYKAVNFPRKWKVSDTLIKNKKLKDPSLLLSSEINLIVAADDQMQQLLYSADSLHGEWKLLEEASFKKGNETRPGGRFFKYKHEWYLPIQDRSLGYGSGISIYRLKLINGEPILKLVKKRLLGEINDNIWFDRGMHHLDVQQLGKTYYAVYDGDSNPDGEKAFQYKRTLKYNWFDLRQLWEQL